MGNQPAKKDISPDEYAEYMKLKQEAEYKKQLEIQKHRQQQQRNNYSNSNHTQIGSNSNSNHTQMGSNSNQGSYIENLNMEQQDKGNMKRNNMDVNIRNSMNNRGINNKMINNLRNPIGETTIEDKTFKNDSLFERSTSNIDKYHHFERNLPQNTIIDNPKDNKDNFMDKVDNMLNDRMFENNSESSNTRYYPRMDVPKFTEKPDQRSMEATYQELCNNRNVEDPVKKVKKKNIETQNFRRTDYLKKIKEVNDPFKLLGLDRRCDLSTAKNAYKKLALKLHPDRGGDPRAFSLLTKALLSVTEEIKAREVHDHNDMKKDFDTYTTKNNPIGEGGNKKINLKLFNEIYEKNKLFDPYDNGYSDWINKNKLSDEEPKELFSNGFNIEIFNKVFDQNDDGGEDYDDQQVIKYGAPTPQLDTSINYTELGVDKVRDFSKTISSDNSDLNYTDYRKAHTKSKLIDVSKHSRKEYKNINDLESERERITYELNGEDSLRIDKANEIREKEEYDRRMKQREYDEAITKQFDTVNRQYLGR